jgi:hypothetical protein
MSSPTTVFQLWFVVFLYALPVMLYAAFAALSFMSMSEGKGGGSRALWAAIVLLVPILGGAAYLVGPADAGRKATRRAVVISALIVWLVPLAVGIWLAGGPLGPKAL